MIEKLYPGNIYKFKVTIETLEERYEICSKLIIKKTEDLRH